MKEYVEKGREMWKDWKKVAEQHLNIEDAGTQCGFDMYIWEEGEVDYDRHEYLMEINLTDHRGTINVLVARNGWTGGIYVYPFYQVVNPETDDWDGEKYYVTEA